MFKSKIYYKLAQISFRIGIFFLVSAPAISALCFIFSLLYTLVLNWRQILIDKWNFLFFVASIFMVIIAFVQSFEFYNLSISIFEITNNKLNEEFINWNPFSSLIGLWNWVPLFICFFGFQPYLSSFEDRKIVAKLLVAGSLPVLVSGFGQYWFNWYGQLETMNGLIIWFQKKTGSGITSIFTNQNYAGCWLNIVLPFAIAMFCEKTKNIFKKSSSLLFVVFIALASYLTTSRNAWGGMLLIIPLILGPSYFYLILPIFGLLGILVILKIINLMPDNIDSLINTLLPSKFNIFSQFSPNIYTEKIYNRSTIFLFALKMIAKSPLIGMGAATFPIYYKMQHDIYMGHAHNLFLDFAFSYGIIVALIVFANIFLISYFSIKKIYFYEFNNVSQNIFFERAWCSSFLVLLISQMFDVQYFDLRISLSFWILLAGMKCIACKTSDEDIEKIKLA